MLENVPNMFNSTKRQLSDESIKNNIMPTNGKINENKNEYNVGDKNNKRKRVEIYDKIINLLNELKTMDLD